MNQQTNNANSDTRIYCSNSLSEQEQMQSGPGKYSAMPAKPHNVHYQYTVA